MPNYAPCRGNARLDSTLPLPISAPPTGHARRSAAALPIAGWSAAPALAQEQYPTRSIELIVPWGPGGGADQLARLVGKLVEPIIGQAVPVLNVPGGTGSQNGSPRQMKRRRTDVDGHVAVAAGW